MTQAYNLVVIRMDIIWQWLQFILIDLALSQVFQKYSLIHMIHDPFFTEYLDFLSVVFTQSIIANLAQKMRCR